MRILYFGDGRWATLGLKQLVEEGYHLLGVVLRTQPTDPSLALEARGFGLPIYQPRRVNASEFVRSIVDLAPDLNLSVSYDQILRRPVLETARLGFINFHAGKLPDYRGRNVINWAIINSEIEIGLTAHFMDEGIDTGDIILQRTLRIGWTDTYSDVLSRVIEAFPELVVETVRQIADGRVKRRPQAHLMGTYFAKREDGDEWLDWSDTSRNLYNKIRAITHPGPGARTLLKDQVVIVWRAFYDPAWPKYIAIPGQVVGHHPGEGVIVKTGDSVLLVQEAQIDDSEVHLPNWQIGTRLGINLWTYFRSLESRLAVLEQCLKEQNKQNSILS